MLECLCHGAADYIVKPLKAQVIKTLFLNVYRYRINNSNSNSNTRIDINSSSLYVTSSSPPQEEKGKVWPFFEDRLKSVFMKENWLQKTVFDYYAPPKSSSRRSSMASIKSDKIRSLQTSICSWDFLPLDMEVKELVHFVCLILNQALEHPDLAEFRVSDDEMFNFAFDIYNSYHNNNPYHNFRHAVDVLQSTYYFLCQMGILEPMDRSTFTPFLKSQESECERVDVGYSQTTLTEEQASYHKRCKELLRPIDILALLMASIGHDVGHPGVTNMFMIQSETPLAVLYNDRSVLESYHSMAFFHLLRKSCFSKLTYVEHNPDWKWFRKMVVHCILATDMGMHDDYVQRIEKQADHWHNHDIDLNNESEKDQERLTICGALIKCADIGNCTRPFSVAKRWARILAEEFARQGDLEKELGLNVLPINDRGKVSLGEFQLTFEKAIALKLYKAVAKVIPGMSFCLDFINENIEIWENNQLSDSGLGRSEPSTDDDDDDDDDDLREISEEHNVIDNAVSKTDINITPYDISLSSPTLLSPPGKPHHKDYFTVASASTSSLSPSPSPQILDINSSQLTHHRRGSRETSASCHCSIQ
ncbi:hypothetical protein BDC45DRAFT_326020 [Circinella umbellata]|nr:hypothetical protein BDC45DRAFT_326020 [Circinella umbellata]